MKPNFELRPLKSLGHALACAGLLVACLPSQAAISVVTSRVALGGTDTLTWGQLGLESGDPLSALPFPNVLTANNLGATVSNPAGDLFRFDESSPSLIFVGNFTPGDKLLSTFGTAGPLIINFATPVARVGAQIQSIDTGGVSGPPQAFTRHLEAFDASNTSLGSFSVPGFSGMAQVNTAPFIGVQSTLVNISSIHFYISGTPSPDFAINTVSLSLTPVPEPATYLMSLVGGAFLLGAVSRRRQAAH